MCWGRGRYGEEFPEKASPGDQTLARIGLGPKQEGGGAATAASGLRSPCSQSLPENQQGTRRVRERELAPSPDARPLLFGSSSSKLTETGLQLPTLLPMELFKARADCSVSLGAHSTWVFPRGVCL